MAHGDLEVDNLLEDGNMEQLAALVLNGEGRRLVGRQSGNPELQAFIDNVPAYMVRCYPRGRLKRKNAYAMYKMCHSLILGENSCRTHGGAGGKSSRFAKRAGSTQIRGGAKRIVTSRRNAIARCCCIWQYRCHQVPRHIFTHNIFNSYINLYK